MKILCTSKRVTDTERKVKISPDGKNLVTEGMNFIANPFDAIAVEEALRLQKAHGGEVLVVSIGNKDAEQQIRQGLAMGADRGVLVTSDATLDPDAVARVLQKLIEKEKPDVVLMGKQATDDDSNQAGQLLAGYLGWPQATFASKHDGLDSAAEKAGTPGIAVTGNKAQVVREVDGGLEVLEVTLPAVITTDLRLNVPRFPTLPGIMKAKKKPMETIAVASLGVDVAPKVKMVKYAEPPVRKAGVKVDSVDTLISKLKTEAKVI
jgi:electron transfer flavoprotein beta subunit